MRMHFAKPTIWWIAHLHNCTMCLNGRIICSFYTIRQKKKKWNEKYSILCLVIEIGVLSSFVSLHILRHKQIGQIKSWIFVHMCSTPQINTWMSDWVEFFAEHRLGYQLKMAREQYGDPIIYERGLNHHYIGNKTDSIYGIYPVWSYDKCNVEMCTSSSFILNLKLLQASFWNYNLNQLTVVAEKGLLLLKFIIMG